MGPTNPNFQIKIIILVSLINIFVFTIYYLLFSSSMIFFIFDYNKIDKNENLVHLTALNHGAKRYGSFPT